MMSEFDIAQHEWFDDDFSVESSNEESADISIRYIDGYWGTVERAYATLSRKDIIALAKGVNLTAEELK